jgi:hypothetical protein
MEAESPNTDAGDLLEFLYRLGQAYLACGEQTAKVELLLRRTASAYGVRRSRSSRSRWARWWARRSTSG